jgi:hypothetical protein
MNSEKPRRRRQRVRHLLGNLARIQRGALVVVVLAVLSLCSGSAHAYPWMIRHDYTACAQCHVDPSGGGPLTAYGRAMGEVLLRSQYGEHATDESAEPGAGAKFLWGALPLPEWLDLGGTWRIMSMTQRFGDAPLTHQFVYMQQDLNASINAGHWVASGSLGYEPKGGVYAALTNGDEENLVSRYHWIGYRFDEEGTMLLRAGRMNLPFGIRDVFHTLTIRTATRTNIDDEQQHGVAFSYSGSNLRAEIMAILGNFQIRPDDYRERGYTGYVEWAPNTSIAAGLSSRIAHVSLDPLSLTPMFRHAHGLFGRWASPWKPLVMLGEVDYILDSPKNLPHSAGTQAMLQFDIEPWQGIHYQLMGEAGNFAPRGYGSSYSGWVSFDWFFFSHMDFRIDGVFQSTGGPGTRTSSQMLLAQYHLYL